MKSYRTMIVVVTNIEQADSPVRYFMEMTVDGVSKKLKFEVRLPDLMSVGYEREFETIFRATRGARKIASLVIAFHKSEPINFPVAIEVITSKPPLQP
jgi:hypothetical protein